MGKGFGDLPDGLDLYENSRVVILPIPFGKTITWIGGTERGPDAILEASRNMELYDMETDSEVYKVGIHTAQPVITIDSREMVEASRKRTSELINDSKFVVALGGEHTVSLGVIEAHLKHFPRMSVLHLDAHADTRDEYHDDKLSHACVMARVLEHTKEVVSVGIRSMDASEKGALAPGRMFRAIDIATSDGWVPEVISQLKDDVYITIDLDVFDPGIMPSTGTPEPGGLGWYQVLGLLRAVFSERDVVGFDVVELAPAEDKAPDFLAAKLVYSLLSYKFS